MRSNLHKFHPNSADNEIIREAIEQGVIDWPFMDGFSETLITPEILEAIELDFASSEMLNSASFENAGRSPQSIHYRDHTRGLRVHPTALAPYGHWSTELARFVVPYGSVGVIKAIDQYLAHQELGQTAAFIYTLSGRWGCPGPWHTGNANELTDMGRWHFRLQRLDRAVPPWWDELGPHAGLLPGLPYPDKPFEDLLIWPAHSAEANNVHLVIPGGYMLRAIFEQQARPTGARVECLLNLRGYVQSDRTTESSFVARTHW
jgi:hypothetical protein